ncbi:hypothetical protein PHET_11158, partial [Paragonimus heterotremus]
EPDSLGRLLDLYVCRTHHLWASPQVQSWLERNVETVLGLVEPHPVVTTGHLTAPDPRLKEYSKRYLFPRSPFQFKCILFLSIENYYHPLSSSLYTVLVTGSLLQHLHLRSSSSCRLNKYLFSGRRKGHSSNIYIFDPLPPADSIDIYSPEEDRRRLQSVHANRGFFFSFFASLLPDYSPQQRLTEVDLANAGEANDNTQAATGTGHALRLATERLAAALRRVLDLHQEDNDVTGHTAEQTRQHEPD